MDGALSPPPRCAAGIPPLLLDLEACRTSTTVVAVFRVRNRWGRDSRASNYSGLRTASRWYPELT